MKLLSKILLEESVKIYSKSCKDKIILELNDRFLLIIKCLRLSPNQSICHNGLQTLTPEIVEAFDLNLLIVC